MPFTDAELDEIRRADAEIEAEFVMTAAEYWYSEHLDHIVLRERHHGRQYGTKQAKCEQYYANRAERLKYQKEYNIAHRAEIAARKAARYQQKKAKNPEALKEQNRRAYAIRKGVAK